MAFGLSQMVRIVIHEKSELNKNSFHYLPIIQKLNELDIKYVVVDGYAVVLHGFPRLTVDLGLAISFEKWNLTQLISLLKEFEFEPVAPVKMDELLDEEKRDTWKKEKSMIACGLRSKTNPLLLIDLMIDSPILFDELYKDSVLIQVNSSLVRVCSLNHLFEMKQSSQRQRDFEDVEGLKKIMYEG